MISKAIQNANDEAKKRVKEQQSFETATEHEVQIKLDGLRQYVPLGAVRVNSQPLIEYLTKVEETTAAVEDLKKIVDTLIQSNAEQARLLDAVVQTLKGVKL